MTGNSKKLKIQRPNSLKIAIIILLFHSESYDEERRLTKEWLYRIIKSHYKIENTRAIKNQIELLKADGIIIEHEEKLRAAIGPDFIFKIYRIISEAPEDIFPLYEREIDFFHYVIQGQGDPKQVWKELLENRYRVETAREGTFSKAGLFSFLLMNFTLARECVGPDFLSWCSLRYLARLLHYGILQGEPPAWNHPTIVDLQNKVMTALGPNCEYEAVFDRLRATVTPELRDIISKTCFPPLDEEYGQIPYVLILGASLSAKMFFMDEIRNANMKFLKDLAGQGENRLYSSMDPWLFSLAMQDSMKGNLRDFHYGKYTFELWKIRNQTTHVMPSFL